MCEGAGYYWRGNSCRDSHTCLAEENGFILKHNIFIVKNSAEPFILARNVCVLIGGIILFIIMLKFLAVNNIITDYNCCM